MAGERSNAAQLAIVVLCAAAVWLAYKVPLPKFSASPPPKVELLPFNDTPPAWDGSYPVLTVRFRNSDPRHYRFDVAVMRIPPTVRHEAPVNQFEVDLHSGMFILRQTDLFVPDVMPLVLTRTYRIWSYRVRTFGIGTDQPYDICPTGTRHPYTYDQINLEDDRALHFERISKGTGYADAVFRHSETSSEFYGAQDAWNGDGWTLKFRDGSRILFPESYNAKSYAQGAAFDMFDAAGHHTQLKRDAVRNLKQLVSPSGRMINFRYDQANRIVEASDDSGHVRRYTYDVTGHLVEVSDGANTLYRFHYDELMHSRGYDPYMMTRVEDGSGNVLLQNEYAHSAVSAQKLADGQVVRYDYLYDRRGNILESRVVLPNGKEQQFFFKAGVPADSK